MRPFSRWRMGQLSSHWVLGTVLATTLQEGEVGDGRRCPSPGGLPADPLQEY